MTASPDTLRSYLADPQVRRSLTSSVQRRVPARDAEDVVQSVLCAALAADTKPAGTADLPAWIGSIARHKVADVHRRVRRDGGSVGDPEIVGPAPAVEHRDLAARIARQAAEDPEAARALDWIAREHDGETWAEIAASERISGAAVRKRISRFRRTLRLKWLGAVAMLLVAGGSWLVLTRTNEPVAARPEPEPVAAERPDEALPAASIEWSVERVVLDAATPSATRALAEREARDMRVRREGERVELVSPRLRLGFRILRADRAGDRETLLLRSDAGPEYHLVVTHGDPTEVRIDEGRWHGTLFLRRR